MTKARAGLEQIYGSRLRGVFLFGSFARGQQTPDSDIDIAVVLDTIADRFEEHERTSTFGSVLSLETNTLVNFLFLSEADYRHGRYMVCRTIQREGLAV